MKIPNEVQKIVDACNLPEDFAIEEHSNFAVKRAHFAQTDCCDYRAALRTIAELLVSGRELNPPCLVVEFSDATEDGIDIELQFDIDYAEDPEFIAIKKQLEAEKLKQQEKAKKVQVAKATKKQLTVTEQLRKIALENPELVQQIAKEIA